MREKTSNLVDLLRSRAGHQPEQKVYTYLSAGEEETDELTYRRLDGQARAVAASLQQLCRPGDRALLLYQPGLEFIAGFFGCLYAGVIAVPSSPPHPARLNRALPKLNAMAQDADPTVVLTTSKLLEYKAKIVAESPAFQQMQWLSTDEVRSECAQEWSQPRIEEGHLAFIQYTSGSTSEPKGVMVSHSNLMHNSAYIAHTLGHTPESVLVSWLPVFHDMGLIYGILQPLFSRFQAYIMPPASFIQRPFVWLQAISRYKATHSHSPNFGYELCARKLTPAQKKELDLSSWRVAVNGAEPVRQETIDRFIEVFEPCGFHREAFFPAYGLAEATLLVTAHRCAPNHVTCAVQASALEKHRVVLADNETPPGEARILVSSGRTEMNVKVAIVNPETIELCAPDEVGEVWIKGPSVAKGYWNNPAKTEDTFQAFIRNMNDGPYLRTGDLGFLRNGELFVTGRRKDLIIIGGANYYPQDIELTVEQSHACLRPTCSAAFSIDEGGGERLVVVVEVERGLVPTEEQMRSEDSLEKRHKTLINPKEVIAAIRRSMSETYDLCIYRVVLIKTGTIPKTSSGKIQRQACRKKFLEGELEIWAG